MKHIFFILFFLFRSSLIISSDSWTDVTRMGSCLCSFGMSYIQALIFQQSYCPDGGGSGKSLHDSCIQCTIGAGDFGDYCAGPAMTVTTLNCLSVGLFCWTYRGAVKKCGTNVKKRCNNFCRKKSAMIYQSDENELELLNSERTD